MLHTLQKHDQLSGDILVHCRIVIIIMCVSYSGSPISPLVWVEVIIGRLYKKGQESGLQNMVIQQMGNCGYLGTLLIYFSVLCFLPSAPPAILLAL